MHNYILYVPEPFLQRTTTTIATTTTTTITTITMNRLSSQRPYASINLASSSSSFAA